MIRRGRAPGGLLAVCCALTLLGSAALAAAPAVTVRAGEAVAFNLSADAPGKPAKERAARANAALATVLEQPEAGEVRVEHGADSAVVYVGEIAIVELMAADAALAGAPSLDAFANERANALRLVLASERKRSKIAETVLSFSLVIFFALVAFYLIKRVAKLSERARDWLDEHGDRSLAVSVKSIELVRPAVVKSSAVIALWLARWMAQFGIFYAWLVVVLSLFEATRGYTERLTGFVVTPLSLLTGRALAALPVVVVAGVAALAVFVLVRFTGLFLASVARRETALGWLPSDLAAPASLLLRVGIVVAALVFAAPVVTGSADDPLGRAGTIVLWALGIAATPLLATGLFGATLLFNRRLAVGDHVRIKGELGRITAVNLLELRLSSASGSEWRVPHLLLLMSSLERLGASPRVSVELVVSRAIAARSVLEVLTAAGQARGGHPLAEIAEVETRHVRYRLTVTLGSMHERSGLLAGALEALATIDGSASFSPDSDGASSSSNANAAAEPPPRDSGARSA